MFFVLEAGKKGSDLILIGLTGAKKKCQMAVGEQKLLSHWEVALKMFFVREAGKKGYDLILIGLTGAKKNRQMLSITFDTGKEIYVLQFLSIV